ncbi:MAG: flavodoxin family protein [Pseudomonadales bacterium]|nr:flavodoxin family protein [Pseudomonadales bacterium]
MKISILYSSETEHTHQLAKAIHAGCVASGEIEAKLFRLSDQDFTGSRWNNAEILAELDSSDAIIFGSPTFMGSMSSKLKAFMEATVSRYFPETWNGKIAAGFTVSGSSGGDKFNTLSTLTTFAMQHGMIWIGLGSNPFNGKNNNASGHYYGATGRAELDHNPADMPSKDDLNSGEFLGARIADYVTRLATK